VLQHVPHEPLGTLDRTLRQRRVRIRYVNFARTPHAEPQLDGYDAVIVLGGPMNVEDQARLPHLKAELRLIDEALRRDVPLLGICLGAQLMAHALGAKVGPIPHAELGWHEVHATEAGAEDPVLSPLAPRSHLMQWHEQGYALPTGAVQLARSQLCPEQAFRCGARAYGLQFHLEADARIIDRWLRMGRDEVCAAHGECGEATIRQQTAERIHRMQELAQDVFGRLVDQFGGTPTARTVLAHGHDGGSKVRHGGGRHDGG
jgi:GMP synthase (glutamine-hydrolysing)